MDHLSDTSVENIRTAIEEFDDSRAMKRLFAALAYKHGVSQSELAAWFGVERKTIYNWLQRLATGDLEHSARDAPRTGRPRKLSDSQREQLAKTVRNSPKNAGLDQPAWSTDLLQSYLARKFDIEYSKSSCRRLFRELGLNSIRAVDYEAERKGDPEMRAQLREAFDGKDSIWIPQNTDKYPPQ